MHIIKWLMGHPILATWALGAIAILLTIGGPGNTKKHEIDNRHITTEHALTESPAVDVEKNNDATAAEASKTEVVEADVAKEVSLSTAQPEAVIAETVQKLAPKKKAEPFKQQIPGDREITPPSKTTSEAISDLGKTDTQGMLQMAREAYWNNGLDEAVQIYQKLIEVEPDVVEHKGELGNVYWRQGYPKKAAELYSEIAVPLVEAGSSERVMNMIGFIQLFYPDRVEVILDRIERIKDQN